MALIWALVAGVLLAVVELQRRHIRKLTKARDELADIRGLCMMAGMSAESTTLNYLRGVFYMLKRRTKAE